MTPPTPERQREIDEAKRQRDAELKRKEAAEAAAGRARALAELVAQRGPRYSPERVSLENYVVRHKGQRETLERMRTLAARLPEMVERGENLILFGAPGTGKDHLMGSLLHLAVGTHGVSGQWFTGEALYKLFRSRIKGSAASFFEEQTIQRARILAISDPVSPAGDASDWAHGQLHDLIDQRYNAMRPTWLTVNAKDEDDIKAKLTFQTYDRLRHGGHLVPFFWPSFRGE